jgi:Flp pilus assembly pilin Flp
MVEYALIVGLIAIIAMVGVATLGSAVSGLFGHASSCIGAQTGTNTQSGTSTLQTANSLSSNSQQNGGNQLSTGLQINNGNPPDATTCDGTTNDQNQQTVLQLLR